ncbi:uncharacterized protein LOC129584990 [Paramacrobiotus metropolitanus]|uniref:uncharacterized protein LOC129584990 n=1 Tax=Paramacrobiotus metropolitanus TaxID=2943436 RepID=UPI002445F0B5|nr:uncharacterized protein LOC129584990 [Paramacrobiotus metropolitanus]
MPMSKNLARSTVSSRAHRVHPMQYRNHSPVALPVPMRSRPLQRSQSWTRSNSRRSENFNQSNVYSESESSADTISVNKTDFDNTLDLLKQLNGQLEAEKKQNAVLLRELEKERLYGKDLEARLERNRQAVNPSNQPSESKRRILDNASSQGDGTAQENVKLRNLLKQYAEAVHDLKLVTRELHNDHRSVKESFGENASELHTLQHIVRELALTADDLQKKPSVDATQDYCNLRRANLELQSRYQSVARELTQARQEMHLLRRGAAGPGSGNGPAEVRMFEQLYDAIAEARTEAISLAKSPVDSSEFSGWFDSLCKDIEMRLMINKTRTSQENFR